MDGSIAAILIVGVTLVFVYVVLSWLADEFQARRRPGSQPRIIATAEDRPGATPLLPPSEVPIFEVSGLRKLYTSGNETVVALDNIKVTITAGLTGIVGPSGGGKTTTLNCLGGLDRPDGGSILFKGELLRFDDPRAIRRFRATQVAWVFQELNLIGHQSVLDNVALPLLCQGEPRQKAYRAAWDNLCAVGMEHYASRRPDALSRGEKQRVAIARAFTSTADVILADEPTGSLDSRNADKVMLAFRDLSRVRGKSVLLVTHDQGLANQYCDRILTCKDGKLTETPPKSVISRSERFATPDQPQQPNPPVKRAPRAGRNGQPGSTYRSSSDSHPRDGPQPAPLMIEEF